MPKLVALWDADESVRIGQSEAAALAKLGVTGVALLRDDERIGVVLEGWAFDPARHGEAATAAIAAAPPFARLLPVADMGVSNTLPNQGGTDAPIPSRPGRRGGRRSTAGP
jgi:hypothetical protein